MSNESPKIIILFGFRGLGFRGFEFRGFLLSDIRYSVGGGEGG